MGNLIGESDSDFFLEQTGYTLIEQLHPCSRLVYLAENSKGEKVVIKRDDYHIWSTQSIMEKEVYEKLGNLERIPKIIDFVKDISKKMRFLSSREDLEDYALIQEHIEGKHYFYQALSGEEEQKFIDLVNTFHDKEYSNLDLIQENLILTPNDELYLVDFGRLIRKKERGFETYKKNDLLCLEELLAKERGIL